MPKKAWFGLALFSGLLLYQFFGFNLIQDDAFISFRYVRNFLDGHGLVFNIGERVEGYTNFFWIMLLAFLTGLGLPLIETARWAGVLAAVGTLGVALYAARRFYPERGWLWMVAAPFLLAVNGALAYWAGSGLETALFTLLASAAAVTYFTRPAFALLFLALATLTRPEGGLLAFLFGIAGILLKEKSWKETLIFWGSLTLLLLPFAIFKWVYYGSLLPNPFYAKTGFSKEYLQSGLGYVWLFLQHYGGYGLFLILPLLLWKKLTTFSRFCHLVFIGYTLYLISIGGDVLKAHRFFVPTLFFLYFPLGDAVYKIFSKKWYKNFAFVTLIVFCGLYAYIFPQPYLKVSSSAEKKLVSNMTLTARYFAESDTAQSFALTTIGAFSYYAGNRRVIDMLGLTEPVVAKNPENIEGLISSWKERHFNAGYVLSQKPDIILFSTGVKPSAPAERALFLYPDFRQNYRLEFLMEDGHFDMYYGRFQNRTVPNSPDQPAHFANLFNESMNQLRLNDYGKGIELLRRALADGPKDCALLYTMLGLCYLTVNLPESAKVYLLEGMKRDGEGPTSLFYYRNFLFTQKRFSEAAHYDSLLLEKAPFKFGEYFPALAF